jgi:hypothetical protein
MSALAIERGISRNDFRKQFSSTSHTSSHHLCCVDPSLSGLNAGERQALADLQDMPGVASNVDLPSQDATTDDIDLESLRQCTGGDKAFFQELCETLQPLCVC